MLVCGGAMESLELVGGTDGPPLTRFRAKYQQELGIEKVKLGPLDADDVTGHLQGVFPGLDAPMELVRQLVSTTLGNPLFLTEIIRKLVLDQKVRLVGQEWAIDPLEKGYLPRSLEEVVALKIEDLNQSSKDLLAHASTLGEDVPLSVLAGRSDISEEEVLAFLDRAEDLGLVQHDFQLNDETTRFFGKRVMEICYGQVAEDQRQKLHERTGEYQETLNEEGLWTAASMLAYHFKRSSNRAKARRYEQMQVVYSKTVFDPSEAARYADDTDADEDVEERLTPESLPRIPTLLRALVAAVRAIQLYPAESRAVVDARRQALDAIEKILADNQKLHLTRAEQALLANGQRLDVVEKSTLTRSVVETLERAELKGVSFAVGITETELGAFFESLSAAKPETIDHEFWTRFSEEKGLAHLGVTQMRYDKVRQKTVVAPGGGVAEVAEEELGEEALAEIPNVLRAFNGAAENIKLYPLGSRQVSESIEELRGTVRPILGTHPAFSLAVINRALLANGARVSTESYELVANRFMRFLEPVELRSITFKSNVTKAELETLFGAFRELPPEIDVRYWQNLARERGLSGLSLKAQRYKIGVVETVESLVGPPEEGETAGGESPEERVLALADQPSEALRAALPQFGKELLVGGEVDLFRRMVAKIYQDFGSLEPERRVQTLRASGTLLDSLILAVRHRFLQTSVDPLLAVLAQEDTDRVLKELADLVE